jgi:hypothetical protein
MTPAQFWAIEQGNQQNQRENMQQMTSNVFSSLTDLAGHYAQKEGMKRAGKAYKQTLPVFASALGIGDDQLKQMSGMDDMDLYYAMESMRPILPSMINAQLGQQRIGVQQAGQAQAARMPGVRNQAAAQAQVAAGQGRMTTLPSNINADAIP